MEKKSLKELQSKGWYRLLKVLFLGMFLFTVITSIALIFTSLPIKKIDEDKTQIICLLGNEKTFSANKLDIYLSLNDFEADGIFDYEEYFKKYYSTQYNIREILEACSSDTYADFGNTNIFLVQASVEVKYDDNLTEDQKIEELEKKFNVINKNYGSDSAKYLTFDPQIFSIHPVYSNQIGHFIGYLFLTLVSILGVFELVRRVFYYIVLGTWKPSNEK